MKHQSSVTQESFDSLLAWLDPDRDRAAGKYELIRRRLIKYFTCRCRHDAEELTDETINRVTLKATGMAQNYVGDPSPYFYGVAQNVLREALRKKAPPLPDWQPTPEESDEEERKLAYLDLCMDKLTPANRKLLIDYFRKDKRAKIDHRKELAARLRIGRNALRIRVYRLKAAVEECMRACLGGGQTA
jgi:RNA polymerase sigma factor (sigma-70 family)